MNMVGAPKYTVNKLMKKIKALREAGLRAEHMAFNFMKRRVQPLMPRGTSTWATKTRRGCSVAKSTTMILLRG
jgi:hypothetical protein